MFENMKKYFVLKRTFFFCLAISFFSFIAYLTNDPGSEGALTGLFIILIIDFLDYSHKNKEALGD